MSDEFEGAVDIAEALDPSALDDFSGDVWSLKRRNWEITDTEVTLKNDDGDVDELSEATKVTEVISFTTEVDGRELTIVGRYFKVFPSNPDHEPPDLVQNIGRSQLALIRTTALGRKLIAGEGVTLESLEGLFVSAVGATDNQGRRTVRYFQKASGGTRSPVLAAASVEAGI